MTLTNALDGIYYSYIPLEALMIPAVAKVFMNGRSQAVRLPKEFRFDTSEVYVVREDGRVILYPKPEPFNSREEVDAFFSSIHSPDFELDRDNEPPQKRELF